MIEKLWRYTCNYCGKTAYSRKPPSTEAVWAFHVGKIPGLPPVWFAAGASHYCSTKCHNEERPGHMSRGLPPTWPEEDETT